ncbi:hypothetical protein [Streptomyces africanus]|uniref:hypothetical protein n=1 Tax=Streptomyces africanus TaxID=231024 RepID=UPI001FC9D33B|nr:hypothetical protein [Streptomyces africanus]
MDPLAAVDRGPLRHEPGRAGAVDVALCTTASVDAVVAAHPDVDRVELRAMKKDRGPRSALCSPPWPDPYART